MNDERALDSAGSVTFARPLPRVLLYAIIISISLLIGFLSFEVYHRYVLYNKILKMVDNGVLWIQNQTLTRNDFDDYFGRKTVEIPKGLFKINTTFNIAVNHPAQGTLNFSVRTNNLGFLSDRTYQFERDPQNPEYRIVMLGDSMTGPTTSTYQWVDTVEDLLNTSQSLKKSVGGKTFRVYNLGWVAAGFQTFWKAYEKAGQYFSPDLIVVNYIEIDFPRTDLHQIQDENEMIEHARSHLSKLQAVNPNLLVALMPSYSDMLPTFTENRLTQKLTQAEPRIKVEIMRDHLPTHLGAQEIERWFQVPHDAHYSDRGGEIYARALARVIAERVSGDKIDFSKIQSQHSNEVLGPDAPPTRKIVTPLSQISDDPEKVAKIKSYIRKEMLQGKVYTFYPYSFHALLGLGDGLTIPYTKDLKIGYVKVPIGSNEDDFAYLSLSCLSGPATLRNPKCYHHFHMFVK